MISAASKTLSWLAASSMANGKPSTCRQISECVTVGDRRSPTAGEPDGPREEPHRVGFRQWSDRTDELGVDAERPPAGGEQVDAGTGAHDGENEGGDRVDDVFAVVEDEQAVPPVCESRAAYRGEVVGRVPGVDVEGRGDGAGDEIGRLHGRQVDDPYASTELIRDSASQFDGETGLADSARPGEGDQAVVGDRPLHGVELVESADEGCQRPG